MGYSCTKAAADTLDKILHSIVDPNGSSNAWTYKGQRYFYERGRENLDGAITGTVWKFVYRPDLNPPERAKRAGTVRIEADGSLTRFPHIPLSVRAEIAVHMILGT